MTGPPEAITAAARAMSAWWDANADLVTSVNHETGMPLARVALDAAAPLIVADVLAKVEQGIADGAAEVITQAVTAERDRIRQLAIDENAWYGADPECLATDKEGDCPHCDPRPFADLLRGDQ